MARTRPPRPSVPAPAPTQTPPKLTDAPGIPGASVNFGGVRAAGEARAAKDAEVQARALAFSAAYSSAEIVPASSSALARAISSDGLPATERM